LIIRAGQNEIGEYWVGIRAIVENWPSGIDVKLFEPLRLKKKTVELWLKFKFVHFVSRRMDLDLEGQRAMKRRRMNESCVMQVGSDIGNILTSKAGADCKIKTSCGKVFHVHRCILTGNETN
jgi:hypothetical protein